MNLNAEYYDADDTIDLRHIFRVLLNHWYWIVISALLALILAMLYLRGAQPVYTVDGLIQVDSGKNTSAALLGDLVDMVDVKSPAQTEIELIKSRFILGQAIKDLHLDVSVRSAEDGWLERIQTKPNQALIHSRQFVFYRWKDSYIKLLDFKVPEQLLDQPLQLVASQGQYQLRWQDEVLISGRVGQSISKPTAYGLIQIHVAELQGDRDYTLTQRSMATAVRDVLARLTVAEKGKMTGIINLGYQGQSPLLIQNTLNQIMQVYVEQNFRLRSAETQKTLSFLENQLPDLRRQLEEAEKRYNVFRRANNTIDVQKEAELLLTQSVGLKTKRIELEQKRAELQARYTADYPLLAEVNKQIEALVLEENKIQVRLSQLPEIQRQYLQLYRDVQVNGELYTKLLNSYQQMKVIKASQIGNVRLVDSAMKPLRPIKPQKSLVLLIAVLLGSMVGIALAFIKNSILNGVKDLPLIEQQLGLSVLATVPRSMRQRRTNRSEKTGVLPLLAVDDPEDTAIESLRSLRTQVHFISPDERIILITGPAPGIGKSFLTSNFAVTMAQIGKSVVLIDGDMRRGHLHDYFDEKRRLGLSDYLQGQVKTVDEVCMKTQIENLDFIDTGTIPPNPAELLLNRRFDELLEQLQKQYDYVIMDSPPILAATDAVIMGRRAGVTLMVARYAETNINELVLATNRLKQAGIYLQGVVLNDVQQGAALGQYYQYSYDYRSKSD